MSEKRFYRASVCGDDGLYDKEDGCIIVNVRSNIDLDDNWNTVVDKLNEYTAYEHLVYRQQNTAFDPTRSTADLHEFTYVNEQAKKAMDRVRSDFEAAHPDLDFDMLAIAYLFLNRFYIVQVRL